MEWDAVNRFWQGTNSPSFKSQSFGRRLGGALAVAMLCGSLIAATPVSAQDDGTGSPVPGDEQTVEQEPTPDLEPTLAPEVIEEPTLEPVPTEEIAPTEVPTAEPTSIPTVEPTPAPTLSYLLSDQPECKLAPDQPDAIASGGALDYQCTDRVSLTGTAIVPDGVTVKWNVQVSIDAGWSVQLLSPVNENEIAQWTDPNLADAHFAFEQLHPAGSRSDVSTLDTTSEITYSIRITRPNCNLTTPELKITHGIEIVSAEAAATSLAQSEPEPLRIKPGLQAIPEPSVAFAGPLNFGEISVTATGPDSTTKTGIMNVIVSDLNQSCGDWSLHLASTPLADEAGNPLSGSSLVVVAVDGTALPDGGCDLANGCDLATLTGAPDAAQTQSLTLDIELRMPDQPGTGAFQTSLSAALLPLDA